VTAIQRNPGEQTFRLETSGGTVTAKKVVNAAGVWSPRVSEMVGVELPILPRKGHLIVAARDVPIGLRKVMEFGYLISKFGGERQVDPELERYGVALVFEPTESQNFLIGSSRQFVGFDSKVDWTVVRLIARRAIRFYPRLADFLLIRTYCGLRPWTPDHLPIISAVEEVPGYYVASGHEGDGISLAAITGKLISEMLTGQPPSVPLEPLRYDRFKRKEVSR